MKMITFSITYCLTKKRSQIHSYEDIEKGSLVPQFPKLEKEDEEKDNEYNNLIK